MRSIFHLITLVLSINLMAENKAVQTHDSCNIIFEDSISKCDLDSVILEAKSGFSDYEWDNGSTSRLRWVKETDWYYITAENSQGDTCRDSVFVEINESRELRYDLNKSPYLCKGDSIVVELNDGFLSYWWNTGHRGDRAVLYPSSDQTVVVEALDSNGCEARIEFKIFVDDCDSCDLLPEEIIKCADSVVIEAENGFEVYEWYDGTRGRIRWVDESGWYKLDAEDSNGNLCTDSVYVDLNSGKELRIWSNPSPAELCIGDSIVIELSGGFREYWWSTGHRSDRAVLYPTGDTVVVIEAVDSNGCETRREFEIEVDSCTAAIMEDPFDGALRFYPNPVKNHLHLSVKSKHIAEQTLKIYNVYGKKVLEYQITFGDQTIDLSTLTNTMFFIKIGPYGRTLLKG